MKEYETGLPRLLGRVNQDVLTELGDNPVAIKMHYHEGFLELSLGHYDSKLGYFPVTSMKHISVELPTGFAPKEAKENELKTLNGWDTNITIINEDEVRNAETPSKLILLSGQPSFEPI